MNHTPDTCSSSHADRSQKLFDVAILAGGFGTRLLPATQRVPKALLEVNGEPFIAHQLRLLRERGLARAVVCAGHLGEMIREFVGDGARFGLAVAFSMDGPSLLGTAGALKKALPLLSDSFFVLYGDSYLPCDYCAVQESFLKSGKAACMTIYRNEGQWDRSNVEFADGALVAYEKTHPTPRMHYIDYGLGVLSQRAFVHIPPAEHYDLAHLYQDLLRRGDVAAFEVSQRFYEIGSFRGIEEVGRYLANRAQAKRDPC